MTVGAADGSSLEQPAAILTLGGRAMTAIALQGETAQAIPSDVVSAGIDLLAMGASGHRRVRTMIDGSTATALLRSCRIPVVVFR